MSRPWILDGGLATELEAQGHTLHPRLWSAGVFLEKPEAVAALHREYIEAGAEILTGASYQMSLDGLAQEGLDHAGAVAALRATVQVARAAASQSRGLVLVAASIGPYGAALADGSEFHGRYGLSIEQLADFHRERLDVLRDAGADLLAIETIPSLEEAQALVELLAQRRTASAWISFTCCDGKHLRDGTPLAEAARVVDACSQVVAIGVNCTEPQHVASLIDEILGVSSKRVLVYPNSGETWDAESRQWSGRADAEHFLALARAWAAKGVWAVGGCCRVGPGTIRELAAVLSDAGGA